MSQRILRERMRMWAAATALLVLTGCGPSGAEDPATLDLEPASTVSTAAQEPVPAVAGNPYILDLGSATLGPTFQDGQWQLMMHESQPPSGEPEGLWRPLDQAVIEVRDQAEMRVPDSEVYEFLDADPGDHVWALPQTQETGAPVIGLSAEASEVLTSIDQGVTISLSGMQGPGTLSVYTQTGAFGEPEVLWDSREGYPQPYWLPVEEQTPLNWVFTEPGVYLVQLTARAELLDGSVFSDTQILRFAIGSRTSGERALGTEWTGTVPTSYYEPGAAAETPEETVDVVDWVIRGAGLLLGLLLVAGLLMLALRRRRRDHPENGSPVDDRFTDGVPR